jgi:hypothetical protein
MANAWVRETAERRRRPHIPQPVPITIQEGQEDEEESTAPSIAPASIPSSASADVPVEPKLNVPTPSTARAVQEEWKCAVDAWSEQMKTSAKRRTASNNRQEAARSAHDQRTQERAERKAVDDARRAAEQSRHSDMFFGPSSTPAMAFAGLFLRSMLGSDATSSTVFAQPTPTRPTRGPPPPPPISGFGSSNNEFWIGSIRDWGTAGFRSGAGLGLGAAGAAGAGVGGGAFRQAGAGRTGLDGDAFARLLDMSLRHPQPTMQRGSAGTSLLPTAAPPPSNVRPNAAVPNPGAPAPAPAPARARTEEAARCPVCLETSDESPGTQWSMFPCCRKPAHVTCAREALRRDNRCPMCRTHVS